VLPLALPIAMRAQLDSGVQTACTVPGAGQVCALAAVATQAHAPAIATTAKPRTMIPASPRRARLSFNAVRPRRPLSRDAAFWAFAKFPTGTSLGVMLSKARRSGVMLQGSR
jgi:hypothetical protein